MGSSIPPEDAGHGIVSAEPPTGDAGTSTPAEPAPPEDAAGPAEAAPAEDPPGNPPPDGEPPLAPPRPRRRRRKVLIWTASITAGVVALAAVAVFMVYRHLNGNIQQRDVSGL